MWKLTNKDPEYLKTIEALSLKDVKDIPTGDGKARFMPMMSEGERDQYLHDEEPVWKKFNQKLKEIMK